MKFPAKFLLLALLLLPGLAQADDLQLAFVDAATSKTFEWTIHDVEPGALPSTTVTTADGDSYRIKVELEVNERDDGEVLVTLDFGIYTVVEATSEADPKTSLATERWLSSPRISVPKGEEAYIRQGHSKTEFIEVHATYVEVAEEGNRIMGG